MRISVQVFCVLTALLVGGLCHPARGAEIGCLENFSNVKNNGQFSQVFPSGRIPVSTSCRRMFLKGMIVPGDDQKFYAFLKAHHPFVSELYLSSPGGSVKDAIAIGRLTRAALLKTHAPVDFTDEKTGRGILYTGISTAEGYRVCKGSKCHCASACFLVWAAGWEREGNVLGIHRPTAGMVGFGDLPPDRASVAYREIIRAMGDYLSELEIPRILIDRMTSTSSEEMTWLSHQEAAQMEYAPSLQEWLKVSCGGDDLGRRRCRSLKIYHARDSKPL